MHLSDGTDGLRQAGEERADRVGQAAVSTSGERSAMRKTLLILLVLLVLVVGVAFYLGWLAISASHDSEAGRTALQFVIDQNKIRGDIQKVKDKIAGATSSSK